MNSISKEIIIQWITLSNDKIQANKQYLTTLDAAIGDADHGANMSRGFSKVLEKLNEFEDEDIGIILKKTGMILVSSVGGAAGPLYGKFFLQFGSTLTRKNELSLEDLATGLANGLQAICTIGRSKSGEKTMIDVWEPAVNALKQAIKDSTSLPEAIDRMISAAEEGLRLTINMIAQKGRASYLGERSIGHQDPGATSSFLILSSLKELLD